MELMSKFFSRFETVALRLGKFAKLTVKRAQIASHFLAVSTVRIAIDSNVSDNLEIFM